MAFLIVNGVTVPVAVDGASQEFETLGDRARAFDGTLLSTRRAVKRKWQVKTAPMPMVDALGVVNALLGTPPISCSGDLLGGAVSCDAEVTSSQYVATAGTARRSIEFTLHEV